MIVEAAWFRVHHSRSREAGAEQVPPDDNPSLNRGDQETFVELGTNGSLQNLCRNNINVADLASLGGLRCRDTASDESKENA